MEIQIVGNPDNKKKRLNTLLSEHYPQHDIINQESIHDIKESLPQNNIVLLIIILTNKNLEMVEELLNLNQLKTPVLIVEEEDTELSVEYLRKEIVKGYVRRNAPLGKIKSAMNLVLKGGIYKEPTEFNKSGADKKVENELLLDWTILSMNSKGFAIEDISEVVKLPKEQIKSKLETIKNDLLYEQPSPVNQK